jgi:hypothetical protein
MCASRGRSILPPGPYPAAIRAGAVPAPVTRFTREAPGASSTLPTKGTPPARAVRKAGGLARDSPAAEEDYQPATVPGKPSFRRCSSC